MDLKVGYGNHDDHDSEKRLRHQQIKENSTTGTLHLRLGGTQVRESWGVGWEAHRYGSHWVYSQTLSPVVYYFV